MIDSREILRLHDLEKRQRNIAWEVHSSRVTVVATIKTAEMAGVTWPLEDHVSNEDLQKILFPGRYNFHISLYRARLQMDSS